MLDATAAASRIAGEPIGDANRHRPIMRASVSLLPVPAFRVTIAHIGTHGICARGPGSATQNPTAAVPGRWGSFCISWRPMRGETRWEEVARHHPRSGAPMSGS